MLLAEFVEANRDRLDSESHCRIDGYVIERQIRSGGQGTVFKATHRATRRPVALKTLLHGSFATSRQQRRFEREIEIVAALRHPGIVTVYDSGRTEAGHHYLAMEFVDGVPLDEYFDGIADDRIAAALPIFESICETLAYAHQRGVVHRDLKPSNILIDQRSRVRVLDFGLAKCISDSEQHAAGRTVEGEFRGTLAYASPEQVRGRVDEVDVRSDVYALGAMLYEILTGRPLHGSGGSLAELIHAIEHESPPSPRSLNRAVDDDLQTIVMTALAKDPSRRYQSADALLADVRHYLANEPLNARRDSGWYVFRKLLQRHRWWAAAAASVIGLLCSFALFMSVMYQRAAAAELDARQARLLEQQQRVLAENRERELKRITEFQHAQLSGIDAAMMGVGMRADLLERVRDAQHARSSSSGGSDEEVERAVAQLEGMLAGVNFTDAALRALDAHIFGSALEAIEEQFADQLRIKAELLQTLSTAMVSMGLYERAARPQAEAIALRREELGDEHPETLYSISKMGELQWHLGRFAEAERYYRESLEASRRVLGGAHPQTLMSMNNLGALAHRLGEYDEAEVYYREVLERRRDVRGDEHPETLQSINAMGVLLMQQGRLAEAEPYFREALAGFRRVLGDAHAQTLASMSSMGTFFHGQGRLAEAEQLYREVLEARRRNLGSEHPSTLLMMSNLQVLLRQQGKLDEAEAYGREVLEAYRRIFGNEHPQTLKSIHNMGVLLRNQGRLVEAEPFYRESLETRRLVFGDEHPDTLDSLGGLGVLLSQQGKHEEAAAKSHAALAIHRRVLGDEHGRTLVSMSNLSSVLRSLGELEEAEQLGAEAVDLARRVLPAGHWHTAMFLSQHARTVAALERFDEAEALMLEAHSIFDGVFGERHQQTRETKQHLAEIYDAWHEAEPDAGHDDSAATWRGKPATLSLQ